MDNEATLLSKRAEKVDALEALATKMGADEYAETPEDEKAFGDLKAEIDASDKKIARIREALKIKAATAKPVPSPNGDTPKTFARPRHSGLKAYKGDGADERAFRVGQWIKASFYDSEAARNWCRENGVLITRAASEGVNSAGGFLVPEEMQASIIDLREQFGVFRREAQIVPMGSDTLNWPRRTGGVTAYFIGENTAPTESQASWDNVNLVAKKLAALTRMSTELSDDAIVNVADWLTNEIAYAFSSKEDDCGFNGDGTSTYGGIRGVTTLILDGTHNAGKVAAVSPHNTFEEIDAVDITKLMGTLPAYALAGAKFYTSQYGFAATFERLVAAGGGNSIATLGGEIQYRYLGFPVVISQKMVGSGDQNAKVMVMFGNLRLAAAMGERRVVTIKRSDDRYFDTDQIGLMGTERIDINVHDLGDNTNAGPVVGLVGTT